eukprot:scaffold615_cov387-Pavlova_lutheri.AAC.5
MGSWLTGPNHWGYPLSKEYDTPSEYNGRIIPGSKPISPESPKGTNRPRPLSTIVRDGTKGLGGVEQVTAQCRPGQAKWTVRVDLGEDEGG